MYQRTLFAPEAKVEVSFDNAFEFEGGMYAGQRRYRGPWRPRRHFLGSDDVPAFDGTDNGEEFQCAQAIDSLRSEENTSELQSLMRTSYAVFCLKNKKKT